MGRLDLSHVLTEVRDIAIVDDHEPLREALGSVFKAAGFSIDTFASAEEFLDSPHRDRVACLILDVRLPGMSGIELQRRLLDAACLTPVIFVAAHGDEFLRDLLMQAAAEVLLEQAGSERRMTQGNSRRA